MVFRSKATAKENAVKVKAQNRSCFTAIPSGVSRTRLAQKLRAIFLQRSLMYFDTQTKISKVTCCLVEVFGKLAYFYSF